MRWDNRRVAGPYDVFLQWANQNVGTPVPISDVDAAGTVKRVADVLSRNAQPHPPSLPWQLVSRCPASLATLRALHPRSTDPRPVTPRSATPRSRCPRWLSPKSV